MPAAGSPDDLIDEREYAAPRELVFECWTVAEHFARWFGPRGAEVTDCEIDARVGGAIRFQQRVAATGVVVSVRGVFDEVVAPERLQFTCTFVDAEGRPTAPAVMPDWPIGVHLVMIVELSPTPSGTRMIVRQRVAEAEASSSPVVRRHHKLAIEGWRQTAERLLDYLERRSTSWPS